MITAFHNTRLAPQRFNNYLDACRAIERAIGGDCASSYVESPQHMDVRKYNRRTRNEKWMQAYQERDGA